MILIQHKINSSNESALPTETLKMRVLLVTQIFDKLVDNGMFGIDLWLNIVIQKGLIVFYEVTFLVPETWIQTLSKPTVLQDQELVLPLGS